MKKLFIISAAILAVLACRKEEVQNPSQQPEDNDGIKVVASLAQFKTAYSDEGALKSSWLKDDAIGIYSYVAEEQNSANVRFTAAEEGESTGFNQNGEFSWKDETSTHDFYAYYPYSSTAPATLEIPFTVPAVQTQKEAGNAAHLAATDFLYARAEAVKGEDVALTFSHALPVLAISVKASAPVNLSGLSVEFEDADEKLSANGTVNIENGELAISDGSNAISLELTNVCVLTETAHRFYVQITPGHAGKTFNVYGIFNDTKTLLGSNSVPDEGIPAGVKASLEYSISVNVAQGKTATADCEANPGSMFHITDGKLANLWQCDNTHTDHWATVDLGDPAKINNVIISWDGMAHAKKIKISLSPDNSSWTEVYAVSDWAPASEPREPGETVWTKVVTDAKFDTVETRYIKVEFSEASFVYGITIYELEAYNRL